MAGMTGESRYPRAHGGRLSESRGAREEQVGSRGGVQGFHRVRDPVLRRSVMESHCSSDPVCSREPAMEVRTCAKTTKAKETVEEAAWDSAGTSQRHPGRAQRRGAPTGHRWAPKTAGVARAKAAADGACAGAEDGFVAEAGRKSCY